MSDRPDGKPEAPATVSLDPSEIEEVPVDRRSVLRALGVGVGGAMATALGGCIFTSPAPVVQQPVVQQQVVTRVQTGVTDGDSGAGSDPPGYGRRVARAYTGINDADSGPGSDQPGYGRGGVRYGTGVTDGDGGAMSDPAGNGRGGYRGAYTGVTDGDSGTYSDPGGQGRGPRH